MPNLSPSLLAVLRCPVTGSALVQDGDSLVATTRAKDGTTPRYAIEDGIPVLLAPEHTQAGAAPGDQHESSTAQEQHA
ncbi:MULTISPECIES: Trm112 family protein [Sinomonas]|jgi:uncharacterized protein YbaR (Trm112 family)|nr:hypothetical protein [Sinomonas sp. R1AF57]ASN51449.1 hypothetical protein CGQ25_04635 [Sinomonas sp. R1AF57]